MSKLVPCKSCNHQIDKTAKSCPNCSVKAPGQKPADTAKGCLGFIVLAVVFAIWMNSCSEEKPVEQTQIQEEKTIIKTNNARVIDDNNIDDLVTEMSNYYLANIKELFEHYDLYKDRESHIFINWRNNEWAPAHDKKRTYFDDILEKNRRYLFNNDLLPIFSSSTGGLSLVSLEVMKSIRENDKSYLESARDMIKEHGEQFKEAINYRNVD